MRLNAPQNYSTVTIHVKRGDEVGHRILTGGQAVLVLAPYDASIIIHGREQAEALWDAMEQIVMELRERDIKDT
jgi:hypothetical protein